MPTIDLIFAQDMGSGPAGVQADHALPHIPPFDPRTIRRGGLRPWSRRRIARLGLRSGAASDCPRGSTRLWTHDRVGAAPRASQRYQSVGSHEPRGLANLPSAMATLLGLHAGPEIGADASGVRKQAILSVPLCRVVGDETPSKARGNLGEYLNDGAGMVVAKVVGVEMSDLMSIRITTRSSIV